MIDNGRRDFRSVRKALQTDVNGNSSTSSPKKKEVSSFLFGQRPCRLLDKSQADSAPLDMEFPTTSISTLSFSLLRCSDVTSIFIFPPGGIWTSTIGSRSRLSEFFDSLISRCAQEHTWAWTFSSTLLALPLKILFASLVGQYIIIYMVVTINSRILLLNVWMLRFSKQNEGKHIILILTSMIYL